ncbi:MAG TPA: adenylyl-sulfate kinase [Anaeromyxobacteraceae bacterium]|nr:adenylyl-sulfate kinase [Anaeromyxobacteraceae bacterium]
MEAQQSGGFVVWLTGMARTGKTTLGAQLARRFAAVGRRVEFLDGDEPDGILTRGLGVSKDDRIAAVRRLGYVARLLARNGVVTVVAHLSPHREARDAVRREVRRFVEIFVDCPMEVLLQRDGEGLYKKALAGELKNVAGVDDPYEPPTHPEVRVLTNQEKVDQAATRIFQSLVDLKYLGPAEFGRLTGGQRPKRGQLAGRGAKGRAQAGGRRVPRKAGRAARRSRR